MDSSRQAAESRVQALKERRWQKLSDSLATSIAEGTTDITLVCREKKFPAHRFLLKLSSPYFNTMFHCGLEESESGVADFGYMEPDTLEAILDYLYKGEVEKVKTEEQIKKVLSASHLMNLTDLFEYCCFLLGEELSKENFLEIQEIVSKYGYTNIDEKILAFVAVHANNPVDMSAFQLLSAGQMKTMLTFANDKHLCFDNLLIILVCWLLHDLKLRETVARELFACVDTQRVSNSTIRKLLVDDKVAASSEVISQLLKDVALAPRLGFDTCSELTDKLKNSSNSKVLNIIFVDKDHDTKTKEQNENDYVVQQFNIHSMSWLPPKRFSIGQKIIGVGMFYFSGTLHMVGGNLGKSHLLYDITNDVVELREHRNLFGVINTTMCVFKNSLYVIGGGQNGVERLSCVLYTELGSSYHWEYGSSLSVKRCSATVLTSSDSVYVIGGCVPGSTFSVERSCGKGLGWTTIVTNGIPHSMIGQHCVVFKNQLHVVGFASGRFNCWFYDDYNWQLQQCDTRPPPDVVNINRICQFPNTQLEFMLVSTGNQCLPTHAWEPLLGQWRELDAVTGLCKISNYSNKLFTYATDM